MSDKWWLIFRQRSVVFPNFYLIFLSEVLTDELRTVTLLDFSEINVLEKDFTWIEGINFSVFCFFKILFVIRGRIFHYIILFHRGRIFHIMLFHLQMNVILNLFIIMESITNIWCINDFITIFAKKWQL